MSHSGGAVHLLRDGRLERLALASSRQARVLVYNLHVRGLHTYAVAGAGVVVHNNNGRCGESIFRFGTSKETAARLGRKAAESERILGIHGVSGSRTMPTIPSSRAARSELEKGFRVVDTPTRNDPGHVTIVLPKPVTKDVADQFNRIFGR